MTDDGTRAPFYDHKAVEAKWRRLWEERGTNHVDVATAESPFYNLMMFPYPSAEGLHVGNMYAFTGADIYGRMKRMQGFNVLLPQAFHATGEPILGTIERLKKHDKTQIETFKLYGATDKDISDFVKKGPEFVAKYWKKKWIEALKAAGLSYD